MAAGNRHTQLQRTLRLLAGRSGPNVKELACYEEQRENSRRRIICNGKREETPNDQKLSDRDPAAAGLPAAAQGDGAACALTDAVTEPVEPRAAPGISPDRVAVRCSAVLGVIGGAEDK